MISDTELFEADLFIIASSRVLTLGVTLGEAKLDSCCTGEEIDHSPWSTFSEVTCEIFKCLILKISKDTTVFALRDLGTIKLSVLIKEIGNSGRVRYETGCIWSGSMSRRWLDFRPRLFYHKKKKKLIS